MERERIAIGGELQRVEPEHPVAPISVTCQAVVVARDVVGDAVGDLRCVSDAFARSQRRVGAFGVPDVSREDPLPVLEQLHVPRLDSAPERELLPELRSDRELPVVRVRRVDRGSGRNLDPAMLGRTVGPKRILGRIGKNFRAYHLLVEVLIEPGLPQSERSRRGWAVS